MKKIYEEKMWGKSNYSGFQIGYKGLWVKTSDFGLKGLLKGLVAAIAVYMATGRAISFFAGDFAHDIYGVLYIFAVICYIFWQSNQWHAAEHKLINLLESLESEDELTMENLLESPACTQKCGVRNKGLKNPSKKKLQEALKVGREYLEKKKFLESLSF